MFRPTTPRPAAFALLMAVLLAALGGGPTHRMPVLPDPALAAFLAMGGTLDDLCGHDAAGRHGDDRGHCGACPLTTVALAPSLSLGGSQARFGRVARGMARVRFFAISHPFRLWLPRVKARKPGPWDCEREPAVGREGRSRRIGIFYTPAGPTSRGWSGVAKGPGRRVARGE